MRRGLFLAALAFSACERAPKAGDPLMRDLSRALAPATATEDTLGSRRQAELEKCKFVYHDEQGLRECLVLKNGWQTQDAARAIAIYKAEIARAVDSVQHMRDSILKVVQRERRTRAAYAATQPYWGRTSTKTYYTNTPNCEPLAAIYNLTGVRFFKSPADAERAGYTRAEDAGC